MGEAAADQVKERIGGEIFTNVWRDDGHEKPRHKNNKIVPVGSIVASKFTKGQGSSPAEQWAWRLSGNRWRHGNPEGVLADLADALEVEGLPDTARDTLRTV